MSFKLTECLGYVRVSTKEQANNSNALEQQIARLKHFGIENILVDTESGRANKETQRTNYQLIIRGIKEGLVKRVVITRLDRLTRSLPTLRKALDDFQKYGCTLWAIDENIDMNTANGKFQINMLGALAEMESDRLSERILRGKQHFREQHRASHPPFGYKVVDSKFELDRDKTFTSIDNKNYSKYDMALSLIEHYLTYKSLNGACTYFQETYGYLEFWPSAFRRWLLSPVLQGHLVYFPKSKNPIIVPNVHEPLLSIETYTQIKDILEFNKKIGGFGHRKGVYSLTGLVKCTCGSGAVIANTSSGTYKYFVCAKSRHKTCPNKKGVRLELLEEATIKAILTKAEDLVKLSNSSNSFKDTPELKNLKENLKGLEQISIPIPETIEVINQIKSQIIILESRIKEQTHTKSLREEIFLNTFKQPGYWDSLSLQETQQIFRQLVDHVLISNGSILEIVLKE